MNENIQPSFVLPSDTEDGDYQKKLQDAKDELSALTPEAYLQIVDYIKQIEDQSKISEACGISWMDWITPNGARINVTSRATTPLLAVEKLISVAKTLEGYGWKPATTARGKEHPVQTAPLPPAYVAPSEPFEPQYVPDVAQQPQSTAPQATQAGQPTTEQPKPIQVIEVVSMSHAKTKAGVSYMRLKGGFVTEYGVPAYPEILSKIGFDISKYEYGKEVYDIPENMRLMWVDTNRPMKVVGLAAKPT